MSWRQDILHFLMNFIPNIIALNSKHLVNITAKLIYQSGPINLYKNWSVKPKIYVVLLAKQFLQLRWFPLYPKLS